MRGHLQLFDGRMVAVPAGVFKINSPLDLPIAHTGYQIRMPKSPGGLMTNHENILKELADLRAELVVCKTRQKFLLENPNNSLTLNSKGLYGSNEDVLKLFEYNEGFKKLYELAKQVLEDQEKDIIKRITDKARELVPEERSVE